MAKKEKVKQLDFQKLKKLSRLHNYGKQDEFEVYLEEHKEDLVAEPTLCVLAERATLNLNWLAEHPKFCELANWMIDQFFDPEIKKFRGLENIGLRMTIRLGTLKNMLDAIKVGDTFPMKPKSVLFTVRKPYYDAIVSGEKREEIRADIPHWRWLLGEKPPQVAVFICGRNPAHRRWITKIYLEDPVKVLGREPSEQGKIDLNWGIGVLAPGLEEYMKPKCIIVELGDVYSK